MFAFSEFHPESNKLSTLGADVELDLGNEQEPSLEKTHMEKG